MSQPLKIRRRAKKEHEKHIEKIVLLIECFDSVRKGHLHAQFKLIKELSNLKGCREELRYIKKDLQKAASVIKFGNQKRFSLVIKITSIIQMVCLQYFILIVGLSFLIRLQPMIFDKLGIARALFTFPVMFLMFTLAIFFLMMQGYVKKRTKTFIDSRAESKERDKRLKVMTQKFIDMLGKEIAEHGEDPKKFRFRVYHVDYQGIHVIKKPGATSDHYTAIVTVSKRSSRQTLA